MNSPEMLLNAGAWQFPKKNSILLKPIPIQVVNKDKKQKLVLFLHSNYRSHLWKAILTPESVINFDQTLLERNVTMVWSSNWWLIGNDECCFRV